MKHPQREEWIPYVFGEAPPSDRSRLHEHLKTCPDCAREIAGWRRSLKELNQWTVPPLEQTRMRLALIPALSWGLAAAVALGFGVLIGRLTLAPETNPAELRAQIESSVRTSLETQFNEALDGFQGQLSNALRAAETRLADVSYSDSQRVWRALLDVVDSTRAEDRRALQALLRAVQNENNAEFVALRKDLETLAAATDDEIRQARLNLMQLASSGPAGE